MTDPQEFERLLDEYEKAAYAFAGASSGPTLGYLKARDRVAAARAALVEYERRMRVERDGWRHVAEYYLGDDFTDTHTPAECRTEAMRRTLAPQPVPEEGT